MTGNSSEDVILFAVGKLADLQRRGLVEGGAFNITADGRAKLERLRRAGFTPSDVELNAAVHVLNQWSAQT
jgi:hypothetical protein